MRYSAFISYNHRDRAIAAWLHKALETYVIPKRLRGRQSKIGVLGTKLPPIFQDREELGRERSDALYVDAKVGAQNSDHSQREKIARFIARLGSTRKKR